MRAGLFGGTFNPIHKGHLKVVEQVLHRFGLDRLYLIPCRIPPHKAPAYLAPAADRVRMIRLALPADRRIHLSEVEIRRTGNLPACGKDPLFRTSFFSSCSSDWSPACGSRIGDRAFLPPLLSGRCKNR